MLKTLLDKQNYSVQGYVEITVFDNWDFDPIEYVRRKAARGADELDCDVEVETTAFWAAYVICWNFIPRS